jgi:hypothetical protein
VLPIGWFIAVVVVALLGLYVRGLVGRLDRLHLRVEASNEALEVQLLRRASLVNQLADSGWLDPASSLLLADAATEVQDCDPEDRGVAESALSRTLRTVFEQPGLVASIEDIAGGGDFLHRLASSSERVLLARRFANEAARSTLEVRRRTIVRILRLAGHAALPEMFEMDDAPSAELAAFASTRP